MLVHQWGEHVDTQ